MKIYFLKQFEGSCPSTNKTFIGKYALVMNLELNAN
jgi:hypothetical protein